jgi:Uma2 family endonuclease
MGEPARRRATYEDVLAAPEHMVAEVIDGELYTQPRPAVPHATASTALTAALVQPFNRGRGGPGGWLFLFEPELHLGEDILVPDLSGWRRERLPRAPNAAFITLSPDWVCEVLSPRTATLDRKQKLRVYAREQVGHVWLVDPAVRSLEVFRLENGRYSLLATHSDDDVVRAEPFDAIELELAVLWADVEQQDQEPKAGP